jgi:3-deoxy-manno-octulosonate cytidylyltransferase (CMP-KDO synthetase)
MKIAGFIPARYASTRFPGKPLAMIHGKSMIQHVYEQSVKAKGLDDVIVATDDKRIKAAVEAFGGKVKMTLPTHSSGTERCAELEKTFRHEGILFDVVINIQGDEPYIDPKQIELVASCFKNDSIQIATLVKKIEKEKELFDENVVKVITDNKKRAIYFSRQVIPFVSGHPKTNWITLSSFYKHIGIYGYRSSTLQEIAKLEKTPLEKTESLEQLRWIENRYVISVRETNIESYAIDVPADLSKFQMNS